MQTYIQSGNVLFTSRKGARAAGAALHDAVLAATGVDSRVVVRTAAQLEAIVAGNPYPEQIADPTKVSVCFLYDDAEPTLAAVPAADYAPDTVTVIGRDAYLLDPERHGSLEARRAGDAAPRRARHRAELAHDRDAAGSRRRSGLSPPDGEKAPVGLAVVPD